MEPTTTTTTTTTTTSGAEAESFSRLQETATQIFTRLDTLAHPDNLMQALGDLPVVYGGILVTAGLVCMIQGHLVYRWVVVLLATTIGFATGWQLGESLEAPVIVAGCVSLILGVLCWPLMKYAVALAGGLAGAFVGANTWTGITPLINEHFQASFSPEWYWVGALLGLLALGLLAFILFEFSVVMFTSISGAVLTVAGLLSLLLHIPQWQPTIHRTLSLHPLLVTLLVVAPALVSVIVQRQIGALHKGGAKPTPA